MAAFSAAPFIGPASKLPLNTLNYPNTNKCISWPSCRWFPL
jgi:hypothetical protein